MDAEAIKDELELWSQLFDVRTSLFKIQKHMNALPTGKLMKDLSKDKAIVKEKETAISTACDLLQSLTEVSSSLSRRKPFQKYTEDKTVKVINAEKLKKTLKKKDFDDVKSKLVFCPQAIEKATISILRETQEGQSTSISGLKAFNQDIMAQIEYILTDNNRLVQRTRKNRDGVGIICELKDTAGKRIMIERQKGEGSIRELFSGISKIDKDEADSTGSSAEDRSKADTSKERGEKDEIVKAFLPSSPHIFNDGDLYHKQVQALLSSGVKIRDNEKMKEILSGHSGTEGKEKKVYGQKLGKGRKLKHDVHKELMGFMPARPLSYPDMTDGLFRGLFGGYSE
ncbi:Protein AATF/Bfr2 like protein [Aduncisulcus paluster]|uniref:Protein AATF/Bfr2 like protein n=1 Tax=Aduncisulcus paluster TaxID=2918883 RepID=A0ABQ5K175_9EUKA|nr:Protein AATF/Bfr2 like protein [Aduncisulcus paluster]|eukprot:gnl/Carplike_NY0171/1962_a2652_884.p1 GENE.gnl/Carplike_NY0171/1962_a2652_884~~gnl/Carplike_NY0171/1962_a2652_884.p1  ORF type:complete len:341 (-),score=57.99 gnl/Carplike_NY0171/1962_a2652_884:32-1054(-)